MAGDGPAQGGDRPGAMAGRADRGAGFRGVGIRGAEGEKASLANEEAVGRQAQGDVVVEAAPGASLEVAESDFLLELAVVPLDPQLESLAGDCALQPRPVVVDGPASRVVAVPLTAGNGHAGDRQSCGDLCPISL